MDEVKIGVDPHQRSNTIEVVDEEGALLGSGRFGTDKAGHVAMLRYVRAWPNRVWAVTQVLVEVLPCAEQEPRSS